MGRFRARTTYRSRGTFLPRLRRQAPAVLHEAPQYQMRRWRLFHADGSVEEFDAIEQADGSLLRLP
jgi:hypothetical protein